MTHAGKALLLMGALALSACASGPDRFDNGDQGAGFDTGGVIPGTVDDPSSAAYFQQRVGDRVLFPVDQSDLTAEARAVLEGQAQWLLLNADYMAIIEGHADEQGTREYNLALGARRANAVMEYLVSRGVPANRMKFVSYGKERPIEVCSQESCYSQNRRAVTIISGGAIG
ncbi:MAG: peptidoglycan-associated lipoprotein Pal [Pelagimonas sp.]|jgi:peptidoglycan-associated lipoprotein|nr:peptidoglycan-associated lipoprotein Pal [Pelagimonas sp.]